MSMSELRIGAAVLNPSIERTGRTESGDNSGELIDFNFGGGATAGIEDIEAGYEPVSAPEDDDDIVSEGTAPSTGDTLVRDTSNPFGAVDLSDTEISEGAAAGEDTGAVIGADGKPVDLTLSAAEFGKKASETADTGKIARDKRVKEETDKSVKFINTLTSDQKGAIMDTLQKMLDEAESRLDEAQSKRADKESDRGITSSYSDLKAQIKASREELQKSGGGPKTMADKYYQLTGRFLNEQEIDILTGEADPSANEPQDFVPQMTLLESAESFGREAAIGDAVRKGIDIYTDINFGGLKTCADLGSAFIDKFMENGGDMMHALKEVMPDASEEIIKTLAGKILPDTDKLGILTGAENQGFAMKFANDTVNAFLTNLAGQGTNQRVNTLLDNQTGEVKNDNEFIRNAGKDTLNDQLTGLLSGGNEYGQAVLGMVIEAYSDGGENPQERINGMFASIKDQLGTMRHQDISDDVIQKQRAKLQQEFA